MGLCLKGYIILGVSKISIIIRVIRCGCMGWIGRECGVTVAMAGLGIETKVKAIIIWFWICRTWLTDWLLPSILKLILIYFVYYKQIICVIINIDIILALILKLI